jgi:Polysaccharide lyase family 4, domain II
LTGFGVAITKAGDLKPARLAHIALLYRYKSGLGPDEEIPENAARIYLNALFKTNGDLEVKMAEGRINNKPLSDDQICLGYIQSSIAALKMAAEWAATENKLDQVKTTYADEEGHFKLTSVLPGEYTLTASGQAGMNLAFWEQREKVVITAGQTTSVKLPSPEQSCLSQ